MASSSEPDSGDTSNLIRSPNHPLQKYPCCIVWTPLPLIGWFFPFVGHAGICRSDGTILDFAASYFVNVGELMFGAPCRYVQFDPSTKRIVTQTTTTSANGYDHIPAHHEDFEMAKDDVLSTAVERPPLASSPPPSATWDAALSSSVRAFQQVPYNLFCSNCHSFVSAAANRIGLLSSSHWTVTDVAVLVVLRGTWVSWKAAAYSILPFLAVMALGFLLGGWGFVVGWAVAAVVFAGWFAVGSYVLPSVVKSR